MARAPPPGGSVRTKATSASNVSQSSAVKSSPSSASEAARLTIVTMCARRAASTKRRSNPSCRSGRRAECNDDEGIVPVSFGTPDAPDLSAGVGARKGGLGIVDRSDDRLDLARGERIPEPGAPRGAIEEQNGVGRPGQPREGLFHCTYPAANGRFRL